MKKKAELLTNEDEKVIMGSVCSRRDFMKKTILNVGTVAFGTYTIAFLSGCSDDDITGPSGSFSESNAVITIDLTLMENQDLTSVGGTLALSGNTLDGQGILLHRSGEDIVKAFSRTCTHRSCTIGAFKNSISDCPCHGSQFNTAGNVVSGPASRSLKQYTATLSDNIITITQ